MSKTSCHVRIVILNVLFITVTQIFKSLYKMILETIITACQRNCRKVMFSVVSVSLFRGSHVVTRHKPVHLGTSLGHLQTYSLGPHHGAPTPPHGNIQTCSLCSPMICRQARAAGIQLKCLLVKRLTSEIQSRK